MASSGLINHLTGPYASGFQLDHQQLDAVILPDLQDMANNAELLEQLRQRRFDRDEPPPYRSPSPDDDDDDENDEAPVLCPTSARDQVDAEMDELISQPLSDEELYQTQRHVEMWHPGYHPGARYAVEASQDAYFMSIARRQTKHYALLIGRAGQQRESVFIRHRIKRRWQRLGVWNPEWGIPGRVDEAPRDKTSSWKWSWQGDVPYGGADPPPFDPQHPNSRAVHLRRGLHRDQRGPLPPRHSLAADTSQSAAESFITSRPWYTIAMDMEEERTRLNRIPYHLRSHDDKKHVKHTEAKWRERGDWSPWAKGHATWVGWKWRHESPSPEPDSLSDMDLTPSEMDALEAIPPPTPSPPTPPTPRPRKWRVVPGKENHLFPSYEEIFSSDSESSDAEMGAAQAERQDAPKAVAAPHPRSRRRGTGMESEHGDGPRTTDGPRIRRSARIAEKVKRLQTDVKKVNRPRTRLATKQDTAAESPALKSGRGGSKAQGVAKRGRPQGVAKKTGPPRKRRG